MYGVAARHHVLETGHALSLVSAGTPLNSHVPLQLARSRWRKQGRTFRLIAALDPAFPNQPDLSDFQWPSTSRPGGQGEVAGEVKAGAKEKWYRNNESALSGDSPLSLPMSYPGTKPATQKEIDAMMNCDPELEVSLLFLLSSFLLPRPSFVFPADSLDVLARISMRSCSRG